MWQVDFKKIFREVLPPFKRGNTWLDYLYAIANVIAQIHAFFVARVNRILGLILFNGQVIYLEHVLNDRFDSVARSIYIENIAGEGASFSYSATETPTRRYYSWGMYDAARTYAAGDEVLAIDGTVMAVYSSLVGSNTGNDPISSPASWSLSIAEPSVSFGALEYAIGDSFIVHIPAAIAGKVVEIAALVDRYKIAGKQYRIETF